MGEEFGGIENLELNLLRNMGKEFAIEFLTPNNIPFESYKEDISYYSGSWYNLGISIKSIKGKMRYIYRLNKFLKKNRYDIIHINSSVFMFSFCVACIARMHKTNKIIAHCHSLPHLSRLKRCIINLINPIYNMLIDTVISCSQVAKYSLINNKKNLDKVLVLENGIDIQKYRFKEEIRESYRKNMNIANNIVYGNVSRFSKEKNHMFLLKIFYEIQKIQKNSMLLLVGNGPLEEDIIDKARKLNLSDKVKFLGFRNDIGNILNCMDAYISTSQSEGFGISLLEAQTNGLKVFCSSNVPKEVDVSDSLIMFNSKEGEENIAKRICCESLDLECRENAYRMVEGTQYDIRKMCEKLIKIYMS